MNRGSAKNIVSAGYRNRVTDKGWATLSQRSLYKLGASQEHVNVCPDCCSGELTWKPQASRHFFHSRSKTLDTATQVSL